MAPFEPKTDSKEFEISNPAQNISPRSPSAAADAADITIRIWRRDVGSGTAALAWNSDSVLVYMISDLVAASHGRTAGETLTPLVAHFDNSFHALLAAKRVQTAILEFLACRPGDYLGAAVLIHPPAEAGFSQGMAQSALRLAEPGQIMLAEEVSRRFQDLPGIELRAVPALTAGGSEHTGLSELIWTSPERLASLRSSASLAPPTVNLASPVGATMIVSASAAPHADPANEASKRPPVDEGWANRDRAFEQGLAEFEEQHSFITKSRLVVGAILVVLVVVGLVLFHPWSNSDVRVKPKVEAPSVEAPPVAKEPAAAVPQPPLVVQPAPEAHAKVRPAAKPPIVNKPPVEKPVSDKQQDRIKKQEEEAPIQGFEGISTYDGMTQKDIPRLLQWARSDAGNGNYTKAAQEYRVVLQLQPSNPDAKEGLRRIQVAQGRDQ